MPAPAPGQDESRDGYIARRMTERTTPRTKAAAVPSVSLLGTRARTRKPKRCQPRELRQPPLASTRALSVPVFPPGLAAGQGDNGLSCGAEPGRRTACLKKATPINWGGLL